MADRGGKKSGNMVAKPGGVLILGTSHVGKSACANRLGAALGWSVLSTDTMGRHPGRPWTAVPRPVMDFYLGLDDDVILWFLHTHHENMRPLITDAIGRARRKGGFVLEGAALRPQHLGELDGVRALCLFADDAVLRERIRAASGFGEHREEMKRAIDKFIERSVRENRALATAAREHGMELVDTTDWRDADKLAAALIDELSS